MHARIALLCLVLFALPITSTIATEPPAALGASPSFDGVELEAWEAVLPLFDNTNQGLALNDDIILDIRPLPAPNAFGSVSWAPYLGTAMFQLITNGGAIGDPATDPAAYRIVTERFHWGDINVTSFHSWRGVAFPDPPFDLEYGNRMHCGLAARGDGSVQFTLSDVLFLLSSSDHILDFAGSLEGLTFNGTTRVGLDYGTDRTPGTPDDVWYLSGEPDGTLVDALFYVGAGNAYWPGVGDPLAGQTELNEARDYLWETGIEFECAYYIKGNSASVIVGVDTPFFHDSFESGDTTMWSSVSP